LVSAKQLIPEDHYHMNGSDTTMTEPDAAQKPSPGPKAITRFEVLIINRGGGVSGSDMGCRVTLGSPLMGVVKYVLKTDKWIGNGQQKSLPFHRPFLT
jgi:hypothetical protein